MIFFVHQLGTLEDLETPAAYSRPSCVLVTLEDNRGKGNHMYQYTIVQIGVCIK
jgi:hypothetical protein